MASTNHYGPGAEAFKEALRRSADAMRGGGMKEINPKIIRQAPDDSKVKLWKDRDTQEIFVRTKCPIGWQTLTDQKGNRVLISSKQEQDAIIRATEIFAKW